MGKMLFSFLKQILFLKKTYEIQMELLSNFLSSDFNPKLFLGSRAGLYSKSYFGFSYRCVSHSWKKFCWLISQVYNF